MKAKLSVVVTTYNSAIHIETCLRSVTSQSPQAHEVIVVDNNSSDQTQSLAKQYTPHVLTHGPERSAQRNFGARTATGTHLMFLDSDMELSGNVLQEVLEKCAEGIEALYIPEITAGNSWWSRIRTFERSFYNQTSIDAVRVVAKDVFNRVHGFDENLTGPEDWDFDKRVRQHVTPGIINAPIVHHEEDITLASYLSKKMYYARNFEKYIEKWGRDDKDIRKQFGLWYRYVVVFTEDGKWKNILQKPHLALSMMIVRFTLGLRYLFHRSQLSSKQTRSTT